MTIGRMRLGIITALLIGCVTPMLAATSSDATALAKVNGEAITVQNLLDAFTTRHSGHATFLGGKAEAREFLNLLIDDRLFVQEAYNIGLDEDESVRKILDEFAKTQVANALIRAEIDEKSKPADEEVRSAWKSLNFMVHARQIAVETKQEAEEIRAAVISGADIDALARTCSRADSRSHGGHMVANWGQFDPEWENIVFALEPGEISPVIETKDGYEVVVIDARADVPPPPIDSVRSQIETVLRQRKSDERKRVFSDGLWRKYNVTLQPIDRSPSALLLDLAATPEKVVATWVGGGSLTLRQIFSESDLRMFSMVSPRRASVEIDGRIRATVNEPLVVLEAAERKIGDQPEIAQAVRKYRDVLAEKLLFRDHVLKDVAVTDDDVRKYYEDNKTQFVEPEQRHVAHVMVSTEKDATEVRAKLTGGADFDEIAKKYSRDFLTAGSGGDLGWITADKVPPAFKEVLTLGQGSISRPVESANGWHIIKVTEIKPKHQLPLDAVKERARQSALETKQRAAQKFWLEKLRAAAKVEIDDTAIRDFVAANQFKGDAPPQHGMK
jgi:parvulin-like peptidyl-prolyl isomerase